MLKYLFKGISKVKNWAAPLGKYIPNPIKKEVGKMYGGVNILRGKVKRSYYTGRLSAEMGGECRVKSFAKGLTSAVTSTKISREDIPSVFALTGLACPMPLAMETGYTVGRLVSSKPVLRVLDTGKKAVNDTYLKISNSLRI